MSAIDFVIGQVVAEVNGYQIHRGFVYGRRRYIICDHGVFVCSYLTLRAAKSRAAKLLCACDGGHICHTHT